MEYVFKNLVIFLLLFLFPICTIAQRIKLPTTESQNRVVLTRNDTIFSFYTHPIKNKKRVLQSDLFYTWYDKDSVEQTQGGFSGRLLNGSFKIYYPNRKLKEEGYFVNGLRNGKWSYWHAGGVKQREEIWERGFLDGKVIIYNERGGVSKIDQYNRGVLSFPRLIYTSDNKVIKTYMKRGSIISDTTSLSL